MTAKPRKRRIRGPIRILVAREEVDPTKLADAAKLIASADDSEVNWSNEEKALASALETAAASVEGNYLSSTDWDDLNESIQNAIDAF
jgi:hypothetical protein